MVKQSGELRVILSAGLIEGRIRTRDDRAVSQRGLSGIGRSVPPHAYRDWRGRDTEQRHMGDRGGIGGERPRSAEGGRTSGSAQTLGITVAPQDGTRRDGNSDRTNTGEKTAV